MISQLTTCIGAEGINIAEFVNKARGEVAYTMMDIDHHVTHEVIEKLESIEGVFKARIIK